jgi:NADH:ubiquinone oxidoreductase subunit 5 (subunit L)/multisubunit Na+/H+ antiporter MnhA subunit
MNSADTLLAVMGPLSQWFNFLAMAAAILLAAVSTLILLVMFHKKKRHRRRKHHRHEERQLNPTLAETGGLSPVRENEKSPGQTPPS